MDLITRTQLHNLGVRARERQAIRISTCPSCFLRWTAQDPLRDFDRTITCPECGRSSDPGRGGRVLCRPRRQPAKGGLSHDRGR